jgi:BlaI family transcriptional regulator, penicillinase repressor
MPRQPTTGLSRREREIMDILHRRGRATVHDVMGELTGDTVYSTVRAQLRALEEKGHVKHTEEELRYVYSPAGSPNTIRRSALKHLLHTFFEGSPEKVVEALVRDDPASFSEEELDRMARVIQAARKGRRK